MGENLRSDEENREIQRSDEEIGENQRSDEEFGESQSSDEEDREIQRSDEEIGENQRSDEEFGESQSSDEEWRNKEEPRCIVSDPAQPHKISRVDGYETKQDCFSCGKIGLRNFMDPSFHYYCPTCQWQFHEQCHTFPSKMIHPYHPQHPLTFTNLQTETGMIDDNSFREGLDFLRRFMPEGFQKTFIPKSSSTIMFDKCTWCGNDLDECFYRCLICNFSLDFHCALKIPPLTIQNPKSHHHSLSLFPRPFSFPCNACGLINVLEPGYACYQCNYVVHQSCIDLPRVIKITRHPHRLSHTPYLPTKVSTCRVCYTNVDIKYGQYSCNHGDCSYVVHSKCATDKNVWDGEELEWVPEESEETKDIAPYKKVGPGLIEHFSHDHHHLKLERYDGTRDSGKQCWACMRSISSDEFYSCIECDSFLHEVCANLPRKLDHALHKHSLYMDPYPLDNKNLICNVCNRKSSCWKYICKKDGCSAAFGLPFQVDVNCILVPECFTHKSHAEHLLFISSTIINHKCRGCNMGIYGYHLHCTICKFAICYKCSTIPNEVYYKFDEHPLSLCYGESGVDDMYWCEVCEKRLNPRAWFYTNKESCTTIHFQCLFGDSAYMKSGHTFDYENRKYILEKKYKVEVVSNGSSSRHTCRICLHHCPHPVYFKVYLEDGTVIAFCSFSCLERLPHYAY